MTLGAKRLRVRIATVPKHERGGRRYGADLKRAVVEHAFARQGEGATIREIAEELGLSAVLLGKWLRHARLRLKSGRVPFAPSAPPAMPPLVPHKPAAKPSAAGSFSSHTAPSGAKRGSASGRRVTRRQVSTPRRIVITATTLAEFLSGAVARYGSIRRAAVGIGIPYSTLRGWLRGRYGGADDHGNACDS
jgi:transposase-like protein